MDNKNTDDDKPLRNDLQNTYKEVGAYLNLGIQMAVTIIAFVLLGWWLDDKFNKSPLFILIFSFVGIFIAFFNFFKAVLKK